MHVVATMDNEYHEKEFVVQKLQLVMFKTAINTMRAATRLVHSLVRIFERCIFMATGSAKFLSHSSTIFLM